MIAKRFSRADICLIAHLTHPTIQDPHYPFSETGVIDYFERATNTSLAQKIYQLRTSLLPTTDIKIINGGEDEHIIYTIRGMIRIANAMIKEYNIPASYLKSVLSRIAEEVKDDDAKYISLKEMFTKCISHDAGYDEDDAQDLSNDMSARATSTA